MKIKETPVFENLTKIQEFCLFSCLHNLGIVSWRICYLLEQAARETAAAAAKEAWEENFKNCPEELQAAKECCSYRKFQKGKIPG